MCLNNPRKHYRVMNHLVLARDGQLVTELDKRSCLRQRLNNKNDTLSV